MIEYSVPTHPWASRLAQLEDGRVEPLDVADLERDALGARRGDELESLLDGRGERLLHQDGQAALDGCEGEGGVSRRGCGDDHRIDVGTADHVERVRIDPPRPSW